MTDGAAVVHEPSCLRDGDCDCEAHMELNRPTEVETLRLENERLRQQLDRASKAIHKLDASVLRTIVNNWRGNETVTVIAPAGLADQILRALDALAIVHGTEEECRQTDEMLEKVFDAGPRVR